MACSHLELQNNFLVSRFQGTKTFSSRATEYMDELARKVTGDLHGEDLLRVIWLSGKEICEEDTASCPKLRTLTRKTNVKSQGPFSSLSVATGC